MKKKDNLYNIIYRLKNNKNINWIVSKYITNPLTSNNKKISLKVYTYVKLYENKIDLYHINTPLLFYSPVDYFKCNLTNKENNDHNLQIKNKINNKLLDLINIQSNKFILKKWYK